MSTKTRLSSKGQVVIPKSLRVLHRWRPGTEFDVQELEQGILLRPRTDRSGSWEALVGCVSYRGPRKTIQEMDRAIVQAARASQ